ncbi:hypothetical protein GGF31_006884 [Allomyces arbusculus]|nr:hypothetical protein GGF31_006884 [Allomyces arbusculus]
MSPSLDTFVPKKPPMSTVAEQHRQYAQVPVAQQLHSEQLILAAHTPAQGMDAGLPQQHEVSLQQPLHYNEAVDEILATNDLTPAADQDVHNAAWAGSPAEVLFQDMQHHAMLM